MTNIAGITARQYVNNAMFDKKFRYGYKTEDFRYYWEIIELICLQKVYIQVYGKFYRINGILKNKIRWKKWLVKNNI